MSEVAEVTTELTTEQRDQYRTALRASREEFLNSPYVNKMSFPDWMEREYGVVMLKNSDGYYTMNYSVSSEKHFMMFQLKFCSKSVTA